MISKALLGNGLAKAVAYDCNYLHPFLGETIQHRAADSGVELLPANADLVRETEVILSVVTAGSALAAAEQTSPRLRPDQIFCACNSVSPGTKVRISEAIQPTGAAFVEAAIMALSNRS